MKQHRLLYCLLAACLLLLVSCKEELDMTILQKTLYEGVAFNEVSVDDAWQVTIVQDEQKTGVELEYSAFLESYIKANQADSKFELGFTRRLNLPFNTVMNATVFLPSLKKLSLDDASTVEMVGDFDGSVEMELDNASTLRGGYFLGNNVQFNLDNASTIVNVILEGYSVRLRLDNGSVLKGDLYDVPNLDLELDNASRMTLYKGTAYHATVHVDHNSFLNMVPVMGVDITVDIDNASEASVKATQCISGQARNASMLYYDGYPTLLVECDETSSIHPL